MNKTKLLVITGATAGGKTSIAANLALKLDGEIISADSRQVYRGMDIGTGKDLDDYVIDGKEIPFHLIDILDAGEKYNVYEFQKDFFKCYQQIVNSGKTPILCGGTGLYVESVIKNYNLISVPVNEELRNNLTGKTIEELSIILARYKEMHNKSDLDTTKRAIRAIEIAKYYFENEIDVNDLPKLDYSVFVIEYPREVRRARITQRLEERLSGGMIEEVEELMKQGLTYETLVYYGLEYKFIAMYLNKEIDYETMKHSLNSAIHQFSKRQMTWFRKMERNGIDVNWIDGELPMEEKLRQITDIYES